MLNCSTPHPVLLLSNCFLSQTSSVNIFCSVLAEIFLSEQGLTVLLTGNVFHLFHGLLYFFFSPETFSDVLSLLAVGAGCAAAEAGCAWFSRHCSHSRVVEWAAFH